MNILPGIMLITVLRRFRLKTYFKLHYFTVKCNVKLFSVRICFFRLTEGLTAALWGRHHRQNVSCSRGLGLWVQFPLWFLPIRSVVCLSCVHVGFLQVLRFPPTSQKYKQQVKWPNAKQPLRCEKIAVCGALRRTGALSWGYSCLAPNDSS